MKSSNPSVHLVFAKLAVTNCAQAENCRLRVAVANQPVFLW